MIAWAKQGNEWVARPNAKVEARIIRVNDTEYLVRVGHKRRGAQFSCACPTLESAQREGLSLLREFAP